MRTWQDPVVATDTGAPMVIGSEPDPAYAGMDGLDDDLGQMSDAEVIACLVRAAQSIPTAPSGSGVGSTTVRDDEIQIGIGRERLGGRITVPESPRALVVFAHGSGSSRHSPRNRYVASVLNDAGLATLLFDLLTPAAALRAAADVDTEVFAIVSRGGRPDLAGAHLVRVRAPTLFIVGSEDRVVLDLNEQARSRLRCESELSIVSGATHLFEEPGCLEEAAKLARDWLLGHLATLPASTTQA